MKTRQMAKKDIKNKYNSKRYKGDWLIFIYTERNLTKDKFWALLVSELLLVIEQGRSTTQGI